MVGDHLSRLESEVSVNSSKEIKEAFPDEQLISTDNLLP